jgi:hypothetical protein
MTSCDHGPITGVDEALTEPTGGIWILSRKPANTIASRSEQNESLKITLYSILAAARGVAC